MSVTLAWIFIICIIVFSLVTIFLLFFTRSPIQLSLSVTDGEANFDEWLLESEDQLAGLSEDARLSYERAKVFQDRHPPDSIPTDITPPQLVSIQEKGVSAFEFEWEPDANVFVAGRTEIQFMYGESCVQTNLPLPRNQEVYYWEAKMYELPETTTVSIGVATKPYPSWRLPGWNRYSIGYFNNDGSKYFSSPFNGKPYGLTYRHGDVIGVGYRHRTGTLFFTRNGRKLEDAYTGLRWNLFPTVGANGPCQIHVNLGQAGFVFVEANVKKWGLAPSQGTLAPPPAYGLERDTILLATGLHNNDSSSSSNTSSSCSNSSHDHAGSSGSSRSHHHNHSVLIPIEPPPYTSPTTLSPELFLQNRLLHSVAEEPVQVTNKYDATQLKNAIDDEVRRYFGNERDYKEGHLHMDVKLLLGYGSCALAAGAFLIEYYTSFEEAKPTLWAAVIVFWILQVMLWAYTVFVEKSEIFVGYKHDKSSGKRVGTMTVEGVMNRYSSLYTLTLHFQDQDHNKLSFYKLEKSVAGWFTEDGKLDKKALDRDLKDADESLVRQIHKD
ncbi:microsomal signal peptidase 25 kDa subunit-domain-containing protein [Dichotomocladium elegans]|nr:microsomal signal peptidase 25 kDa subunit-domain-containing protein [Dichotomocladium elegans]